MNLFGPKRIYLDYASATPVAPRAARPQARAARLFGNPGAIHREGVEAARALEDARERIARELGVKSRELIFVSGGTEANNLALLGLARRRELVSRTLVGTHWVVSAIEHPSVLECFAEIERMGGSVSHVAPDSRGIITEEAITQVLKKETVCVSVGWANSEIGTVQPLSHIARAIRAHERAHQTHVAFHSDAGQAPLYLATTAHSLGVDMLTLDSGKLYGPRGVGVLYLKNTVEISSIMRGGGQERGLRPGTENVALAIGCAEAFARIATSREAEAKRVRALRDTCARAVQEKIPGLVINGDLAHALPHMLNVSIPNIQSEYVTLALDHRGFAISTKSACREGEEKESHVVAALNANLSAEAWRARNTLRISLGESSAQRDIHTFVDTLRTIVSTAM